jgi:hypothetical protein
MVWARMLAYITGTVDQELLLRNEYLAAENRILKAQIKGRLGSVASFKCRQVCRRASVVRSYAAKSKRLSMS